MKKCNMFLFIFTLIHNMFNLTNGFQNLIKISTVTSCYN